MLLFCVVVAILDYESRFGINCTPPYYYHTILQVHTFLTAGVLFLLLVPDLLVHILADLIPALFVCVFLVAV